ncbi:MAG: hypothetical protein IPM42_14290 [Saprospiraceae bacterium]|nr:hypothetical protein [Saprospiraceae bacterium]
MKFQTNFFSVIWVLFFVMTFVTCNADNDPVLNDPNPVSEIPVIMIHGALASGDTYANHAMFFTANGYKSDLLHTFDWNSLGGNNTAAIAELDVFVDKILVQSGQNKVILAGHSAGGGLGSSYCNTAERSAKVLKYIHIGSSPLTKPAGNDGQIPTLNIYSTGDKVVAGKDISGAVNVVFEDLDHYEVATSFKSFEKIYSFIFDGKEPAVKSIPSVSNPKISGRVVTLGENKAQSNITVNVYEIDQQTGGRKSGAVHTFAPDAAGYFGPLSMRSGAYYEFEMTSIDPQFRTLHYYREPFRSDNKFVYLRSFPPANSLAGILLSNLPKDDAQSVIAVFSANKSVIHERDNLIVQGINLSNATLCAPQNSTIAMFLYDSGDKTSSGNAHPAFSLFPFLRGADIFFDTSVSGPIILELNGTKLTVRNYKSSSEGVVIAVFD